MLNQPLVNNEEEQVDVETLDDLALASRDQGAVKHAGEAAKYGIYYDDRAYDYTKHLKKIGETSDAVFISAATKDVAGDDDFEEHYDEDDCAFDINHATYDTSMRCSISSAVSLFSW